MNRFECPKVGNSCNHCVGLARVAFANAYQGTHHRMSEANIATMAENANLKPPLEEQADLSDLSCDERQARARKIGFAVGKRQR